MKAEDFRGQVQQLIADWATSYTDVDNAITSTDLTMTYENQALPDLEETRIWVDVQVRFYSSSLIAVGRRDGRYTGAVSVSVYVRSGEGTQIPDRILGGLTSVLRARRVGEAILKYPERAIPPTDYYGWYRAGLRVPFVLNEWQDDL